MEQSGQRLVKIFLRNRTAVVGGWICVILVLIAILARWISPYDPLTQNVYHRLTAPEATHLFGTDVFGRDVLSRVLVGAQVSLFVGVISIFLGMVVGTALGMIAAYSGGGDRNGDYASPRYHDVLSR